MFGSSVLDILIGLIVIFLCVGLAVTASTEIISHWMGLRPEQLKKALLGMLDGDASPGTKIPENHWFFSQTLLRSMADFGKKFPSYLDRKTFGEALLLAIDKDYASKTAEQLATSLESALDGLQLDAGVKELLRNYVRRSKGDALKFQELTGDWFDRVMDRATGWYKRNVATITLLLSTAIVVAGNIDTVAIARALHGSDALRAKMLEVADKIVANQPTPAPVAAPPGVAEPANAAPAAGVGAGQGPAAQVPATDETAEKARQRLAALKAEFHAMQSAGLPLGWKGTMPENAEWISKLIGWLITICAASLGAPFWFDMLSKIINIRNAGPKPATKTDVVSPPVKEGEH